jgi:hypothetical protein
LFELTIALRTFTFIDGRHLRDRLYSTRSAFSGSTRVARRAGKYAAANGEIA